MSAGGIFVTGTGTEVGKTHVAAAIARGAAGAGALVGVFKPALTGLDELAPGAEPDHVLLRRVAGSTQSDAEIAPYRFGPAVSPHLAAELAGVEILPARLRERATAAAAAVDLLVVEGVGGLLVPLAPDYLVRDFARDLGFPLIVAAAPGLGTINHTLLTVEASLAAGLAVQAIVLTPWPDAPGGLERSNRETLARLAGVEVLALPRLDPRAPETWPRLPVPAGGGSMVERADA